MTTAIRLFSASLLALSLFHSTPKAYAADPLSPSDAFFPAASPASAGGALTGPVLTAKLLPTEFFPAPFVADASLPEKPASLALLPAYRSVEESAATVIAETPNQARNHAWHKRWLISLAPLVVSQSLDASSSWGLRELNPVLAGSDGRFGMKATAIKFGVIGGLMGAEYLLVKKFPASAKFFTMANYATAGITTGIAVHNYMLPGR
jgi:hypothetical protein